ncbi:YqzL family protein [Paenibacillus sp. IB182496]|uniref:YqzL family protein n=1 Tax=Paenibacillus sabuli TaxID=2772509 RepID=A0A927BRZ6_9BACL|nr:YqzL family protein [Paenibacillus sabuli]MBD2844444.1 YqzL family protein [Paenibacillus sabuli]
MRNFSWTYFTLSGDVESFLLYKEVGETEPGDAQPGEADEEDAAAERE